MLNLPIHQVVHAADDTTIPEPLTAAFSIPIYIEPFHTEKYNAIDFEEYVDSEKIMDALCSCILSSRASLWTKLTLYDKLPVGEIHYRVQDDIWYNSSRYDKGGGSTNSVNYDERNITFDKTKNILDITLPNGMNIDIGDVIKPKKDSGRADIWKSEPGYVSLWEVKPPSYFNVNETKGEIQLAQYVLYGDTECQFGYVGSPGAVQRNDFQFEEILVCTDITCSMFWLEYVTYNVDYYIQPNSLIVYSFTRDSKTGMPVLVPNKITQDALERAKETLKKKVKETDPVGVPAPAHGLEPALDNATKTIPATPKDPKIDRVIDETEEVSKERFIELLSNYKEVLELGVIAGMVFSWALEHSLLAPSKTIPELIAAVKSGELTVAEAFELIYPIFEGYGYGEAATSYVFGAAAFSGSLGLESNLITDVQSESSIYSLAASAAPPRDPLVIDLGESGITLTTLDEGVNFDLDNNGFAEKTAWIGVEDGFLALDVNGNGTIDNGSELFGDQFLRSNGTTSLFGYEALADFDDNDDDAITEDDSIFDQLCIWIDIELTR